MEGITANKAFADVIWLLNNWTQESVTDWPQMSNLSLAASRIGHANRTNHKDSPLTRALPGRATLQKQKSNTSKMSAGSSVRDSKVGNGTLTYSFFAQAYRK